MARNERRGPRLDQPLERSRTIRPTFDSETAGRVSERVARFFGSWRFLGWMTVAILAWLAWNTLAPTHLRIDPFPFLFLTLVLSLQASYAAPLILLAQNRQADRDRVQFQEDRDRTERLLANADYLTREVSALRLALGELATRDFLRGEIKTLLEEFSDLLDSDFDRKSELDNTQQKDNL
ncbi:MAG: DUF1003 domain-containing protein [Actinobacteria bacterium]|uniref:Unannotated protein n=1 Tax=freshwater metagenome TaxID=449393 RepID=A0A6J5YZY7_9ZZZZ|nr:DUF1003 domain-containing protein [Actinomycetota bacterium]